MATTPNTSTASDTSYNFHLRLATLEDIPSIKSLIDLSVRELHTPYYTPAQISGALKTLFGVDTQLILDAHYFVIETLPSPKSPFPESTYPPSQAPTPTIIASGGWSDRSTLYGGDQHISRSNNLLSPLTDAAKIRAFFVHPLWTRRGLAGLLLRACEDAGREAGFGRAEMGATLSGVPFYERMGYRELEGGRVWQPVGEGEVLKIVTMGRVL